MTELPAAAAFPSSTAFPGATAPAEAGGRRFVVCGSDKLAYRLVDELVSQYDAEVTVIMASVHAEDAQRILALPGVRAVESDQLDQETFGRAGLDQARALALLDQNDGGNVDAALVAQELSPDLRIVVRIFSRSLTLGLRDAMPGWAVLSAAALAAPAFVAAALGELSPTYVRLREATLHTVRPGTVPAADVLCGLAVTEGLEEPELLPADPGRADLLLATSAPRPPTLVTRRPRPVRALYRLVGRRLWLAFGVVAGLLVAGTAALAVVRQTSWLDAAYLTIMNTFGGASADETARPVEKIIQAVLAVASIALIPLLTAAVVDAMVKARLTLATGGLVQPTSDHVVVVGLGDIGTRVMRALHELGVGVVAVERSESARGVVVARELGVPLIIGDGNRAETLRAASVPTCRSMAVVTSDDVTNLEVTLFGRALKPDLRVVLRTFDGEFAGRAERAFGLHTSRSVSYLAAPAFAAAMLGREVVGTLPVRRHVLIVAELPVGAGSPLEGQTVADVSVPGQSHLLAVRPAGQRAVWSPPAGRALTRSDRLLVVVTRAGLSDLVLSSAPGEPAPAADLRSGQPGPS